MIRMPQIICSRGSCMHASTFASRHSMVAMQRACRLAPLSQGRIEDSDGSLQCSYGPPKIANAHSTTLSVSSVLTRTPCGILAVTFRSLVHRTQAHVSLSGSPVHETQIHVSDARATFGVQILPLSAQQSAGRMVHSGTTDGALGAMAERSPFRRRLMRRPIWRCVPATTSAPASSPTPLR